MLGLAFLDLSDLNDHLRARGYEELSEVVTIIGGEGRGVMESGFVVGGRGGAFLSPSADGPGAVRATLSGGFGMAEFGYAFVHTRPILLTLTAGIGGYGLDIELTERRTVAFDDVLDDPRRSESLGHGGLLAGLTLGFDGRVPIGKTDEKGVRPFFTLGVRAGGLYGPPLGGWSLGNGSDVTDAPSSALSSLFAVAVIGFGGATSDAGR
jgi:hypothetical protein